MRNILKSTLGRAVTIAAIAGVAVTAIGATSAEARPWNHEGYHGAPQHFVGHRYYGPRYGWGYGYRPYYAPPVIYPPAYGYGYAAPGLNINIPL
jgi:hypothetical protein